MSLLVPLLVAAGAAAYFLSKKTPGGISSEAKTQTVPVMLGDGKTVSSAVAEWHATNDQNQLFGPRRPDYWNLNGYFMFASASNPGSYDFYKPDWQVPVSGGGTSGAGYV